MELIQKNIDLRWTEKGKKQRKLLELGWNVDNDRAFIIKDNMIYSFILDIALKNSDELFKRLGYKGTEIRND